MIQLITGKIGGGKTVLAVEKMFNHMLDGGTVVSNIDLVWAEVVKLGLKRKGRHIQREQYQRLDLNDDSTPWHHQIPWGTRDCPVHVYLDEVHLFFNSRDWQRTAQLHRDMLSFLSQSRKACVDVTFIAQVASTLERQFRVQCEWEIYVRNFKDINIPIFGRIPFQRMLVTKKDNETNYVAERIVRGYPQDIFPLYNTLDMLDDAMRDKAAHAVIVEQRKMSRVSRKERKRILEGLAGNGIPAPGDGTGEEVPA